MKIRVVTETLQLDDMIKNKMDIHRRLGFHRSDLVLFAFVHSTGIEAF